VPGPRGGLVVVRSAARSERGTDDHRQRRLAVGDEGGTVELPEEIFAAKVNVPLIHQVVVAQRPPPGRARTPPRPAARSAAAAGSRTGRRAPAGPARARLRAPQFTGGGVSHGPVPRDYAQRTPKKMKAAALRGALSDRAQPTSASWSSPRSSRATCRGPRTRWRCWPGR
jgi:ribosomal protein L4